MRSEEYDDPQSRGHRQASLELGINADPPPHGLGAAVELPDLPEVTSDVARALLRVLREAGGEIRSEARLDRPPEQECPPGLHSAESGSQARLSAAEADR